MENKEIWKEFFKMQRKALIDWWDGGENSLVYNLMALFFVISTINMAFFIVAFVVDGFYMFITNTPGLFYAGVGVFIADFCFILYLSYKKIGSSIAEIKESILNKQDEFNRMHPVPKKQKTFSEIYQEIVEGSDKILAEYAAMQDAIKSEDFQRNLKMYRAGFTRIPKAYESHELFEQYEYLKEQAEYINRYKKYNLPFVSIDDLKIICNECGLLIGDPSDFIADVPIKNMDEIIKFELNDDDAVWAVLKYGRFSFMSKKEYDDLENEKNDNILLIGRKDYIKIIATPDCFDLENKTVNPKFEIVDRDPIVLIGVAAGYLVVTHWN